MSSKSCLYDNYQFVQGYNLRQLFALVGIAELGENSQSAY